MLPWRCTSPLTLCIKMPWPVVTTGALFSGQAAHLLERPTENLSHCRNETWQVALKLFSGNHSKTTLAEGNLFNNNKKANAAFGSLGHRGKKTKNKKKEKKKKQKQTKGVAKVTAAGK